MSLLPAYHVQQQILPFSTSISLASPGDCGPGVERLSLVASIFGCQGLGYTGHHFWTMRDSLDALVVFFILS